MSFSNSEYKLDEYFIFTPPSGDRLRVQVLTAILNEEGEELLECQFAISVNSEVYARIEREALFHLEPEARNPSGAQFDPDKPILLNVALHVDWLDKLTEGVNSTDEALDRLFEWSRSDNPALNQHLLLSTDNWYALHVKQSVDLPEDLQGEDNELFAGYSTRWAEPARETEELLYESEDPLDIFCLFFQSRGWKYNRVEDRDDMVILYGGSKGGMLLERQALVNREMKQCIFYSIAPDKVPKSKRTKVAEFITRANYGLLIGNFEMDWESGYIRFKTSVDVHDDRFSLALAQNLVEANGALMDMYLLGLQAVMAGEATPAEAIEQSECDPS